MNKSERENYIFESIPLRHLCPRSCYPVHASTCYKQRVTNVCRTRNRRDYAASIGVPMDFVPMHTYRNHAHRILCRLFAFRNCNPVRKIAINRQHLPSRTVNRVASRRGRCNSPHVWCITYPLFEWPCCIIDIVRGRRQSFAWNIRLRWWMLLELFAKNGRIRELLRG